jgi:hypothetical protein
VRRQDLHDVERLFGMSDQARLALLRAVWPRVVGADVARRTEVASLTGDLLRIRACDGRWARVLHRMRRDILNGLWSAVGRLAPKQLGFLEGPLATQPASSLEPSPQPAPSVAAGPPPSAVSEAAAAIPDAELRAAFLAAAGRYLQRTQRGL